MAAGPSAPNGDGAVNAWSIGNLAGHSVFREVNHHHFRGVADVEAFAGAVDAQVVPATLAADLDFLDHLVGAGGLLRLLRQPD